MEGTPAFFSEIALLLVASSAMAYFCHRLRITPIVSFLVAGAVIGPHALGLVRDRTLIEAAAEVGVILLLFTIGIEFSLERLARIKRLIFLGGGLQVSLTLLVVAGLLRAMGIGWPAGIFTGFLVALSSTAIVMKLLMSRHETNTDTGQAALGILIFQDLAVVAMVLLIPMLGAKTGSLQDLALPLGEAIGIVLLVLVVARRVMPKVLEAVARTCSQEIFLLTAVAICFGTAWLTSQAGVSLSLGAFLAGLVISESRFSDMVFGEILPLQILFSAIFFVSVGLLLDLEFVIAHPLLVVAAIATVLCVKLVTTLVSMKVMGNSAGTAAFTALMLAQVGEFSFVLEHNGREVGLFPAGLQEGGPQTFIATTVALMMATPFLTGLGERLRGHRLRQVARQEPPAATNDEVQATALKDHVLIAGYGNFGRHLATILKELDIPFLILTLSPDGARNAENAGWSVMRGNYSRRHELTLAGVHRARLLVVADDEFEMTRRVVGAARALNSGLRLLARTRSEKEVTRLQAAGASQVVADELEGSLTLLAGVLEVCRVERERISEMQARLLSEAVSVLEGSLSDTPDIVELSERQRASERCKHTDQTRPVSPSSAGCEECLQIGDSWVHLRVCMTCGTVACCDSSKNKHASGHYQSSGHPIVKSLEPGEDWAWCYQEETML